MGTPSFTQLAIYGENVIAMTALVSTVYNCSYCSAVMSTSSRYYET